jgi:uncharacterized protein YndB with AHSA1/START domain
MMKVTRRIRAPIGQVFAAFMSAEALAAWLPPKGMRGEILRFDPRPGGGYVMTLTYQDPAASGRGKTMADSDTALVRFVEIVPGERIVQAVDFETDDPAARGTMTMTWRFAPAEGGGTSVCVEVENAPPAVRPEDHEIGIRASLGQLDRYLVET